MKAKLTLLAVFLTIFLAFGPAHSALIDGSGLGILLIDGLVDSDTQVSPSLKQIYFGGSGSYDLYYRANGGDWFKIESVGGIFGTFEGGTVIDFAINVSGEFGDDNTYYSFNSNEAIIEYDNTINFALSEKPAVTDDYYRNVYVQWLGLVGDFQLEIVGAQDDDGFSPVPIPGALLLLGSGLIGFIGLRRKLGAKS